MELASNPVKGRKNCQAVFLFYIDEIEVALRSSSIKRIYQVLVDKVGYPGSYPGFVRLVAKYFEKDPTLHRRGTEKPPVKPSKINTTEPPTGSLSSRPAANSAKQTFNPVPARKHGVLIRDGIAVNGNGEEING